MSNPQTVPGKSCSLITKDKKMDKNILKKGLEIVEELRNIEEELLFLESYKTSFGLSEYDSFDEECLNKHLVSKLIETKVVPIYRIWLLERKDELEKELGQL